MYAHTNETALVARPPGRQVVSQDHLGHCARYAPTTTISKAIQSRVSDAQRR